MPSRRQYLRLGVAAAVAGLSGCSDAANGGTADADGGGDGGGVAGTTTSASTVTGETASTPTRTPSPGTVAWRQSLPGAVGSRPALAGNRLFAGTDDGTVAALSSVDGRTNWERDVASSVHGTPTVADGAVLVVSGDVEHQVVTALDAERGKRRWEFAPSEWMLGVLGARDGTVYVTTADDVRESSGQLLYARSLADGSREWAVEIGDSKGGFVTDETAYVPSTHALDAVGLDGTHRWSYEGDEYQFKTLAVAGDTVVLVTSESWKTHTVRGLDAATGEQRWTYSPDEWRAYTTYAADDRLFAGGERVARLDPETGTELWTADQRAALYEAAVDDGTLYVSTREAAALDVEDGRREWRTSLDAEHAFVAGLESEHLLLHKSASDEDRNRHVLALEAASGERVWEFAGERELTRLTVGGTRLYCGEGRDLLAVPLA